MDLHGFTKGDPPNKGQGLLEGELDRFLERTFGFVWSIVFSLKDENHCMVQYRTYSFRDPLWIGIFQILKEGRESSFVRLFWIVLVHGFVSKFNRHSVPCLFITFSLPWVSKTSKFRDTNPSFFDQFSDSKSMSLPACCTNFWDLQSDASEQTGSNHDTPELSWSWPSARCNHPICAMNFLSSAGPPGSEIPLAKVQGDHASQHDQHGETKGTKCWEIWCVMKLLKHVDITLSLSIYT